MHSENLENDPLHRVRHSLAHILAQAVKKIRPGTRLGFGPATEDGFFYDFSLTEPLTDEDLPKIEKEMKKIIKARQTFTREELEPGAAVAKLEALGEDFKVEYVRELISRGEAISFYSNGPFIDMCEGPHVQHTGEISPDAFKLRALAGAYWRGNEKNPMMTRVYGYAFNTKEELDAYIARKELALQRDHRKLGAQLDIFAVDDEVGRGLILWLPNGTVLRQELEALAHEMEFKAGYVRVATPHITRDSLYYTSGHLPYYEDVMYPPMLLVEEESDEQGNVMVKREERYYLKPMNCPHHHKVYAARKRSYRDLPLRLCEYGTVYRYERSGQLQGLTRVRGLTMNDAHIYCTADQIKAEFKAVIDLHRRLYALFDFSDYYMRLSLRDPSDPKGKYVDNPEAWEESEALLREAMDELGLPYSIGLGEAAFYGPKVDFQFRTAADREFTVSTAQLDFAVPARFNLQYTGPDGQQHTPYCIHRAPLGTHERFVAFLIEHYGGAFPTWLAPVQVRILPVSERFLEYARRLNDELRGELIRSEVDENDDKLGKKIRTGTIQKVPILLVVGQEEADNETVTVRRYGIEQQRSFPFAGFKEELLKEIKARRHVRAWPEG